jgi:hypothetical protein
MADPWAELNGWLCFTHGYFHPDIGSIKAHMTTQRPCNVLRTTQITAIGSMALTGSASLTLTASNINAYTGSFGGAVSTYYGTANRATLRTGSPIRPPPRYRTVAWAFRVIPTAVNPSGIAITQMRNPVGTLAKLYVPAAAGVPAIETTLTTIIDPRFGSYRFRNIGAAPGTYLAGMEWTQ